MISNTNMFARYLLESRIQTLPLEIQQIIFTKVRKKHKYN